GAIGYKGDESQHAVIKEIRQAIPNEPGMLWSELRKRFQAVPYGWPTDAIDGAVATLVNSGAVNATVNGQAIQAKGLSKQQVGAARLSNEHVFPSRLQQLQV